jgi:hypothetical protein
MDAKAEALTMECCTLRPVRIELSVGGAAWHELGRTGLDILQRLGGLQELPVTWPERRPPDDRAVQIAVVSAIAPRSRQRVGSACGAERDVRIVRTLDFARFLPLT